MFCTANNEHNTEHAALDALFSGHAVLPSASTSCFALLPVSIWAATLHSEHDERSDCNTAVKYRKRVEEK